MTLTMKATIFAEGYIRVLDSGVAQVIGSVITCSLIII